MKADLQAINGPIELLFMVKNQGCRNRGVHGGGNLMPQILANRKGVDYAHHEFLDLPTDLKIVKSGNSQVAGRYRIDVSPDQVSVLRRLQGVLDLPENAKEK